MIIIFVSFVREELFIQANYLAIAKTINTAAAYKMPLLKCGMDNIFGQSFISSVVVN